MSINEGPFHMGTVSDVIAEELRVAVQKGPVRLGVLKTFQTEEKERYKADFRQLFILLQGYLSGVDSLTEVANLIENNLNERFLQTNLMIRWQLLSNASVQAVSTQSSMSSQFSNVPYHADKSFQLDTG
ncbi:hypothetical protein Tco_0955887 [Tanacetum coccineum]|uniref:Uncharacterized protein n=1 Tax=Tanacetum coccineum TaxID=301880 RepID=A0ABQ5E995_9ASTR